MTREEAIEILDLTSEQSVHFNRVVTHIAKGYEIPETEAIDAVINMFLKAQAKKQERLEKEHPMVVSFDDRYFKVNGQEYKEMSAQLAYHYPSIVAWIKENGTELSYDEAKALEDEDSNENES